MPVQNFDEFMERFEDLFRRTISDAEKEESEFVDEYAQLAQALREFAIKNRATANWGQIFVQMQGEISTFKKPLRTLDKNGECWKHVRDMQMICTED